MSEINITVDDQTLTIEQLPLIASGGVKENYVNFTFSEEWTGYTKTAVFYQDEEHVYYSTVVNDRALIPWESMTKAGRTYIGVFGIKDDIVYTSQVVPYKIVKGAITEDLNPGEPTPDIYNQLIALINGATEAVTDLTDAFASVTRMQGVYRVQGYVAQDGTGAIFLPPSYTYRNTDVFLVFLNGLLLNLNEYTLTGSGNQIRITFPSAITFDLSDYIEIVVLR